MLHRCCISLIKNNKLIYNKGLLSSLSRGLRYEFGRRKGIEENIKQKVIQKNLS